MRDDLANLQGTWNMLSLEVDGQPMPASTAGATITVDGNRFITSSMGAVYRGILEVDAAASPKTFNLKFTAGPEKGNTSLGIYELDGDNWRLCLTVTAKQRPTAFATFPGSGLALETLARAKAGAKTAPSAKAAAAAQASMTEIAQSQSPSAAEPEGHAAPELAGEWVMASCVMDGVALPASLAKMGRRVATGSEVRVTMGPQTILKAHYAVDPSGDPKRMNYVLTYGPAAGSAQQGIYEFSGKKLTTCFRRPGESRPADFTTAKGDGKTLTVWNRVK